MKKFFGIFILMLVMVCSFAAPPGFTGSGSVETAYQSDADVIAIDYSFALTGFFTYSIDQSVVLKDGLASAAVPEFAVAYSKYGFTLKATYSDFVKGKLSYAYDAGGYVTVKPSVYYKKVIKPDTLDGCYGGALVLTKGATLLPALGAELELDADYVTEFTYAATGSVSYRMGAEQYVEPYVESDYAFADKDLVTSVGLRGSLISGISFDLNYVLEENTYEISATVSY